MTSPAADEERLWDAIIIGAGPAGAMAAYLLAQKKQSVLLIDQSDFPRKKVCGGCFSNRALHELKLAGLNGLMEKPGAKPIRVLTLISGRHTARIPLPTGASLSRNQFDFSLIQAAQKEGAIFFSKTKGVLKNNSGPDARVQILQNGQESEAVAKRVLICDGLMGESLKNFPAYLSRVAPGSLIGISAVLNEDSIPLDDGAVFMACSKNGYVGSIRQEDGKIELAAAVQPLFLKSAGTAGACAEKILSACGIKSKLNLSDAQWQGTPPLLRNRSRLSGPHFFILGDASGYIEPFTGEGIYWALLQARKLVSLLQEHHFIQNEKLGSEWEQLHFKIMNQRKKICRAVTLILRSPFLCQCIIRVLNRFPLLAAPLVRSIHGKTDEG